MKFIYSLLMILFSSLLVNASCGTNGEICSSNMNMPIPAVGVTKGPIYATDINNSLLILDRHNHTPGYGVPITPAGLNITSDLTLQSNNLTNIRATRFTSQSSSFASTAPDIAELYVVNGELYYNDSAGHIVPITSGGSVNAGAGSITGLPSGTAGVAYSVVGKTYSFSSATSTAANIDAATYILRYPGSYPAPTGSYIAFQAPSTAITSYALTFPNIVASTLGQWLTSDTSGGLSWTGVDNSTLQYSSNVVSIKNQGVTAAKIANNTITASQIANNTITATQIANNTITAPQIANNTITASQIANATITGTQIQSSVALNGLPTVNSGRAVVSAPGVFTIMTNGGSILSNASISAGTGFTVSHPAIGHYTVTFTSTFPTSVIACNTTQNANVYNFNVGTCFLSGANTVDIWWSSGGGVGVDLDFTFIALGH